MAIPFNLADLIKATPANKILDDRLVLARDDFGIDDKFLAEDMVDYYKDAPPNLNREPIEDPLLPPVSGIYNPNLLPLNFNNDNDRGNMFEDRSPDLELENMYEDEGRFDLGPVDTIDRKKGIMEILGMLPTPLNIARKGIDFFNNYRKEKEIEKQREIEAAKIIEQMRQERIKNEYEAQKLQAQKELEEKAAQIEANRMQAANEQNRTGGYQAGYDRDFMEGPQGDGDGGNNGGGSPGSSGPGGSDSMGSFAYGGQVRRNYFNGGIVSLRGKI